MFTLQFPIKEIPHWATQYDYPQEAHIETVIAPRVRARGYVDSADLVTLCRWKSPRIQGRCGRNGSGFVEEVTKVAFSAENEQLRIEVLTLLQGVSWPMASVILHWCHADRYPLLDFRALWSLGIDTPPRYTFDFWWAYVETCRTLADEAQVSMRELDRALWAYSKFNQ